MLPRPPLPPLFPYTTSSDLDELRKLAQARIAKEAPGLTLQPTALVHEAYLRLTGSGSEKRWDRRGHFFAAARSEEHTSELQSLRHLVCRLLLEKKKKNELHY